VSYTLNALQQRMILILMAVSNFILGTDLSITSVALPTIGAELHLAPLAMSWIVIADTLAIAGLLTIGGRLTDRVGHRLVLTVGLLCYGFGSILAVFAFHLPVLLAARVMQGAGNALISPAAFSLIVTFLPEGPRRRRGFGLFVITQGLSMILGLMLGGWIVTNVGWRGAYLLALPLIAVAIFLAGRVLPRRVAIDHGPLDLLGAVIITAAVVSAISGFHAIGTDGLLARPTLLLLGAAAVLTLVFIRVERRAPSPMVPLILFSRPGFAASTAVIFLVMGAGAGVFVVSQLNLQRLLGFSAALAGVAMLPYSVSVVGSGQLAPMILRRFGPGNVLIAAIVLEIVGMLLLALAAGASYGLSVAPGVVICAVATMLCFISIMDIAGSGMQIGEHGIGTGVLLTSQQIGIALGVSSALGLLGGGDGIFRAAGFTAAYMGLAAGMGIALILCIMFIRGCVGMVPPAEAPVKVSH
jgi:MFS transporter, DHA2 family, methylenomycin A resistance protein